MLVVETLSCIFFRTMKLTSLEVSREEEEMEKGNGFCFFDDSLLFYDVDGESC